MLSPVSSIFRLRRRESRLYSSDQQNPYEIIQDKLLEHLEQPQGPLFDGKSSPRFSSIGTKSPIQPFWDRCEPLPKKVDEKDRKYTTGTLAAQRALVETWRRLGSRKFDHFHELVQYDYVVNFGSAFKSVVEALNESDFEQLESNFGLCLKRKLRAWKSRWEEEDLQLRINFEPKTARYLKMLNFTKIDMREDFAGPYNITGIDGIDTDFQLLGAPAIVRRIMNFSRYLPQKLGRVVRFSPTFGGIMSSQSPQFAIAVWLELDAEESIEIVQKSTGKTLYSEPSRLAGHILKFGTTLTDDHMEPFKLHDMDNIVEDSIADFLDQNQLGKSSKLENSASDSALHFGAIVDPTNVNPSWWIESMRFGPAYSKAIVFERNRPPPAS